MEKIKLSARVENGEMSGKLFSSFTVSKENVECIVAGDRFILCCVKNTEKHRMLLFPSKLALPVLRAMLKENEVYCIGFDAWPLSRGLINKHLIRPIADMLRSSEKGIVFSEGVLPLAVRLFFRIFGRDEQKGCFLFFRLLSNLAHSSFRNLQELSYFVGTYRAGGMEPILEVCEYLRKNFRLDIQKNEMVCKTNQCKSAFDKNFKKTTGITFSEYLLNLRLCDARDKILYTDESIREIALSSGFSDYNPFYKAFTKVFGTSPKEIRNRSDFLT